MPPRKGRGDSTGGEYALVYSTDPIPEKRCSRCMQPHSQCSCPPEPIAPLKPVLRLEKKGRGGKEVTIIARLPARDSLLKDLAGYLKRSLGGGGTFYIEGEEGIIEIQGDRRDQIDKLLKAYTPPILSSP